MDEQLDRYKHAERDCHNVKTSL